MKTVSMVIAAFLATATLISGSANSDSYQSSDSYRSSDSSSRNDIRYGEIESIDMVRGDNGKIGAGTVIGGVLGGVLGHQVGGGSGKDVATVAGVIGGAVVGHQMEKNNDHKDTYHVKVRLDNGEYQTVAQESVTDLRVRDRVRIEKGLVSRE